MNGYYFIFFLFVSSCSFTSSEEAEKSRENTVQSSSSFTSSREERKGIDTATLLVISKQYCFENGLCTGYIDARIDTRGQSIDSILSMHFESIDSFEIENISKIDIEKSQDQEIINLFLKGIEIVSQYKMKIGENRFSIPSDWFFESIESSKEKIVGFVKNGDGDEFVFQINNFSEIKSLDLLIKEMIRIQDDKIEISFQGYEKFSIVFDFDYFKSYGRLYFNDFKIEDVSTYLDEVQKNLLEKN